MDVFQTPTFTRHVKKLHKNQKAELDQTIKLIVENPLIGDLKKVDLSGIRVYKFIMMNQQILLAYEFDEEQLQLILIELGTHENFYRDLKR